MALNSNTARQVKKVLLECGPMQNTEALRAVFVDERIYPWRHLLPEADNQVERTERLIELLHDSYTQDHQNALILFINVLIENTDPHLECHHQLKGLLDFLDENPIPYKGGIIKDRQRMAIGFVSIVLIVLLVAVIFVRQQSFFISGDISDSQIIQAGRDVVLINPTLTPDLTLQSVVENSVECPALAIDSTKSDFDTLMVEINGGSFTLGDGSEEAIKNSVNIDSFQIDQFEVTNWQYQKFISETGHIPPLEWQNVSFPTVQAFQPVTGVKWEDAVAYCQAIDKRLPTEAEWELACRSAAGYPFPWGDTANVALANTYESTCDKPIIVGSYSPEGDTQNGIADMLGNAAEWTSSILRPYPYNVEDGREDQKNRTEPRIIRGGSFTHTQISCSKRLYSPIVAQFPNVGFRCARNVPDNP